MNNILMTKRRSCLADRKEKLLLQKHLYFVCSKYILLMTAFFVCSFSYRDFSIGCHHAQTQIQDGASEGSGETFPFVGWSNLGKVCGAGCWF